MAAAQKNKQQITPHYNAQASTQPAQSPESDFDPKNAFGSLTAGKQQFTILGDTDHGDPSIIKAIAENIPQMAKSGVKHLMIEYEDTSETEALLSRLYTIPPQATYDEILKKSELFESASAKTQEEMKESGLNYAALIIECHKNGIKLHLAGDNRESKYLLAMDEVNKNRDRYITENAEIHKTYEAWTKDGSSLDHLNKDEQQKIIDTLVKHGDKLTTFHNEWMGFSDKFNKERMGFSAEKSRAEHFINLANGEKSVVVFGAAHIEKDMDLNEAIDQNLRQKALKDGKLNEFVPTQVMDVHASRQSFEKAPLHLKTNEYHPRYFVQEKTGEIPAKTTELKANQFEHHKQDPGHYTVEPDVMKAQELMNKLKGLMGNSGIELGKTGPKHDGIDGKYGALTFKSTLATQKILGMDADGAIDNEFMQKLEQKIQELTPKPSVDVTAQRVLVATESSPIPSTLKFS